MGRSGSTRADERTSLLPQPVASEPLQAAAEENGQIQPTESKPTISLLRGISLSSCIFILIFLQTSNISLLTTIQGAIAEDLNAYEAVTWFTSAYLIAMASITPLAGRLCQIFRPQSYVLVSCLILAIGQLVAGTAKNLQAYLIGRVIMGVGTAGNFPVALIVIIDLTSVKRRGLFMGLLNTAFTTGIAFGGVLAAALEHRLHWRSVFWLQIPFAILAGVGIFFLMPTTTKQKDKGEPQTLAQKVKSIDYIGVITLIATIVLLLYGLSSPKVQIAPIIVSIFLAAIFVLIESRYARSPIIPVEILKSRAVLLTCLSTLAFMISRWLVLFFSPMYFIAVRSWPPQQAGWVLLAPNSGFAIGGLLVGWLHIRRSGGFYIPTITTFLVFAAALFAIAAMSTLDSSIVLYLALTVVNGFATGASLNYTLVHLLHLTPKDTHFIVTSVLAMFRGFAGSFGSAIGGGIFQRVLRSSLTRKFAEEGLEKKDELIRKLLGSPRLVLTLTGAERELAQESYEDAIKYLFVFGGGLALVAMVLQASAGWKEPKENKEEDEDQLSSGQQ